MSKLQFFLFYWKLFKITHPMEIKKPHTNMEMLPAQLFLWLYGSLRDPNLLPIISAMPRNHDVKWSGGHYYNYKNSFIYNCKIGMPHVHTYHPHHTSLTLISLQRESHARKQVHLRLVSRHNTVGLVTIPWNVQNKNRTKMSEKIAFL